MYAAKRVAKDLIEAVEIFQDQETNHMGRHTQAIETLTKIFSNTTEKFPEETLPQAQTSTNPTQPNALRDAKRNHQQVKRSNNPGIISAPLQNPMTTLPRVDSSLLRVPNPLHRVYILPKRHRMRHGTPRRMRK